MKEQVMEKLFDHLGFDGKDGTYIYCLTRVKEAFHVGTMTLDDFVEVDEDFVGELADVFMELSAAKDKQIAELQWESAWVSAHQEDARRSADYWKSHYCAQVDRIAELTKALEWYADTFNYETILETSDPELFQGKQVVHDGGFRARQALRRK